MISADLKKTFLTTPLCQYLDPNEIDMLLLHSHFVSFAAGKVLLHQGKKNNGMYFILSGNVKVIAKILGEGTTNIAMLDHGNFVGEISAIENSLCATSVIAISNVECIFIPNAYLETLTLFFPETKYKILKAISLGVTDRLIYLHHSITTYMKQAAMVTRSMFGEVIKSFTKPASIEKGNLNLHKLIHTKMFKAFTQEEFRELISHGEFIKTPKQCTLISADEAHTACYIVLYGAVQSSIVQDNKFAKLSVLAPTEFFGSIAIIAQTPVSIIDYTTCERAILIKFSDKELKFIQENLPFIWYKFFDSICKSFIALERAADKLEIRLHSEFYNR